MIRRIQRQSGMPRFKIPIQDRTEKSLSQDPRSPESHDQTKTKDLGSPGFHDEKNGIQDPQYPRAPGSQYRTNFKNPRYAGYHNKMNVLRTRFTGSRNKM